jgi:hypothetical protein
MLLVMPERKEAYAMSSNALQQAQSPRGKLVVEYIGSLVIDVDGSVRKIEAVEVLGPPGDSAFARFINRLTNAWNITTRLSAPFPLPLAELKTLIMRCVRDEEGVAMLSRDEDLSVAELRRRIEGANSVQDLLRVINLPDPTDALDVL